ncbi:AAA family ATPase [Janthinobacterium tructae]|uniref:ATP-binding protein n=1 Tax=Janthinobacterium tructae TaxID=2590869 RepID=A0A4Y6RB14_9BURK|nr:AAA family ATPase [Janthinobacterium tructae]QDG70198.1 ATP-binding protein [Janthinobacterium tructae]
MLKKIPSQAVLHLLIVPSENGPLPIFLSNDYDVSVSDQRITITSMDGQKMPRSLEQGIASFHTLFGVNGSGKTDILLRIAAGFASKTGAGEVSVLYSHRKQLFFYASPGVNDHEIVGAAVTRVDDAQIVLHSIFYTSSPFESARRTAMLSVEECRDVSPRYGELNQLDGLALLELQRDLPDSVVRRAKMGITHNLLSIQEICERLSDVFSKIDAGRFLRDLLWKSGRNSLRSQTLELRVLCSIAESRGESNRLPNTWINHLAKIIFELIHTELDRAFKNFEEFSARRLSLQRRKFLLNEITLQFQSRVELDYPKLQPILKTMRALTEWLTSRKRGAIQATPRIFETNLEKFLPDRDALGRCSRLGLAVFSIANLSSGESALAVFSAALHGALKELSINKKSIAPFFLLIDEGEMFLHPKWQREYIGRILRLVKAFPGLAARAHIVVSSHSLIIAADTPPNSLIDIDKSRTINGFGLGPKSLLEKVYDVVDLSGEITNPALVKLTSYFGDGEGKISKSEALLTAAALADDKVRQYLTERIKQGK